MNAHECRSTVIELLLSEGWYREDRSQGGKPRLAKSGTNRRVVVGLRTTMFFSVGDPTDTRRFPTRDIEAIQGHLRSSASIGG